MKTHLTKHLLESVIPAFLAILSIFGYNLFFVVPARITHDAKVITIMPTRVSILVPPFAYTGSVKVYRAPSNLPLSGSDAHGISVIGSAIALGIAVTSRSGEHGPYTGTAFWVHHRGFAATCSASIHNRIGQRIAAIVPFPLLAGEMMEVNGGAMITEARIQAQDGKGVVILSVENDPFSRQMHMFSSAKDSKSGKTESQKERYSVPLLARTLANVGDNVFMVGIEPGVLPTFSTREGHILRVGGTDDGIRIFTTIPYKPTYCGAPVLDKATAVIGMVVGKSGDGETEVAPVRSIVSLLKQAQIQ